MSFFFLSEATWKTENFNWKIIDLFKFIFLSMFPLLLMTVIVKTVPSTLTIVGKLGLFYLDYLFDIGCLAAVIYTFFLSKHINLLKYVKKPSFTLLIVSLIFTLVVFLGRIGFSNGFSDLRFVFIDGQKYIFTLDFFRALIPNLKNIFVAPIWEEIFIRFVLVLYLSKKFNPIFSILITSILFASGHIMENDLVIGGLHLYISMILLLFIESLFKSVIVLKTKSITVPILMHIFANMLAMEIQYIYGLFGY